MPTNATTDVLRERGDVAPETAPSRAPPPRRPVLSWAGKIKKRLKPIAPFLGKFRPVVGQCCHQCAPKSQDWKLPKTSPALGFHNLLGVNETHTRYRGWLSVPQSCHGQSGPSLHQQQGTESAHACGCCAMERSGQQHLGLASRGRAAHILPIVDTCISALLLRVSSWMLLKILSAVFCSVQVNLTQLAALRKASDLEAPLVFVSVRQCGLDCALVPLVLFCHNLRVPYTVCHLQLGNTCLRSVLQRLGVILLPPHPITEQDAEKDGLYGPIMTSFVGELLREGQSGGVVSALRYVTSLLRGGQRGTVRIHFAQAFSLKEMFETGRCRVDGGRPLQELLLPAIFKTRSDDVFGQKCVSWVLPPSDCPELPPADRQFTIALTLHLLHATASCHTAVMSTCLVSCLLLHKHRKGVRLSELCRDASWLLEEVLFRNRDLGFGGALWAVMYHALSLLRPHLLVARLPPVDDPLLAPRPTPSSILALSQRCDLLTHVFILEAVGACAVSAMLCEVGRCGGAAAAGGGEMEFDVALSQEELTERALQLCHLLPLGHRPPCQSAHSFALDAVDSLVRSGLLVMEEVPRDHPVCDFWRRQGALAWSGEDEQGQSDSDCEEQDTRSYKLSQPTQCPELLFFLCSLLSVQLRALSWAVEGLQSLRTPLPESECVSQLHACLCDRARLDRQHYESSSADLASEAVRTLTHLGVLEEVEERGGVYFEISPLFQQADNRDKLHSFICQFLYD
ncbi:hypothetical protein AAFF_G00012430 [Aldrovandia affinis]|uniref:GPAT/DHAPAT C-terminal domain-containing protein n=1 Tax=Aldrovandia affinis TaxID=143900 RepID=A0AAD7S6N0_9TELE|nr:hypothetical protein AAFF_G00012430 [Aldrovandia affinis]